MQDYSLSHLIRPTKEAQFFAQTWGQKSALYAGSIASEAPTIMNLVSFEQLLATLNRANEGWLHLACGGLKPIPQDMVDSQGMLKLHKIRSVFATGETLYLTKAERLSHPLMQLARAVELDMTAHGVTLREPVNAHVFLTPPQSQGFLLHRDEHASFVIQLEGYKEWIVYEPLAQSTSGEPLRPGGVVPGDLKGAKKYNYQMQRGDVMFLPEWWPHEAKALGAHSLHVTLRIFPIRWVDLLRELCADHPALDGSLPRIASDEPAEVIEPLLDVLCSSSFRLPLPTLLEAFVRKHAVPRSVLPDDGFGQILSLDRIDVNTSLVRSAGVACRLFETDQEAYIEFPGGLVRGPVSVKQAFAYVASVTNLRPRDLPTVEGVYYDKLDFARTLVKDGLFRIAPNS